MNGGVKVRVQLSVQLSHDGPLTGGVTLTYPYPYPDPYPQS